MTPVHSLILAALALHIVVLATLAALVRLYRRRWHAATERAEGNARFAKGAIEQLTAANAVIRSLEATVADTSRLLTDAQGTIAALEEHVGHADLQRDVALAASRAAQAMIADLEARLTLPEPTPADLVLLDAAVRPERLTDAPVAVPEGCRVEVMRYRPHAVLRGPRGRFVRLQAAEQDNAERAL